jgi:hypothetical protein
VLFFLLVSGDTFLRRLVEILPRFSDKRQAIEISQHIEHDISAYLITVTIMNAAVGLATALVMWLCGLGDPILWGAVAFLLNYVPILGPMIGLVTFTLAGLLTLNTLWYALLPAALYLLIHLVEGETITPMLLARRLSQDASGRAPFKSREIRSLEKRSESTRERPHTLNRCFLGNLREFLGLLPYGFELLAGMLGGHFHEL